MAAAKMTRSSISRLQANVGCEVMTKEVYHFTVSGCVLTLSICPGTDHTRQKSTQPNNIYRMRSLSLFPLHSFFASLDSLPSSVHFSHKKKRKTRESSFLYLFAARAPHLQLSFALQQCSVTLFSLSLSYSLILSLCNRLNSLFDFAHNIRLVLSFFSI